MRAAEEGLPLVRAAQTGISAVFDAFGRRVASLPLGAAGALDTALPGALPPTPFARFGLMIPAALAALALLLGIVGTRIASRRVVPGSMPPNALPNP